MIPVLLKLTEKISAKLTSAKKFVEILFHYYTADKDLSNAVSTFLDRTFFNFSVKNLSKPGKILCLDINDSLFKSIELDLVPH